MPVALQLQMRLLKTSPRKSAQLSARCEAGLNERPQTFGSVLTAFRDDFNAGGPSAPFATVPLTALPLEPPSRTDEVEYAKRRAGVTALQAWTVALRQVPWLEISVEAAVRRLLVAAGSRPELSWVAGEGQNSTLQVLGWALEIAVLQWLRLWKPRRPGIRAPLLPCSLVTVGQVYQVISAYTSPPGQCSGVLLQIWLARVARFGHPPRPCGGHALPETQL
eukprot:jgi/Botrbrau1/15269/Bobra.0382s0010.2